MIGSRRGRAVAVVALAAAAALGLAGCDAIPGSGPVHTGLSDLRQAEQFVQAYPQGPVAGSNQEDIVRGFVEAATSSEEDYAVAREFLSPAYSDQWDPSYGVLIDEGSRPYRSESADTGVLELSAVAKVDADGLMLPLGRGPATEMRFEFEQVAGEWRISSAPAGIILDRTNFTTFWSSHQLYFVGAGGLLAPETRWYLSRAAVPTEIVNGLLRGPSERMAGVLHSGFPQGTALANGAVTVVDGRARVDLTSEVVDAGADATGEMYRQLRESLRSVSGVSRVEILVDGTELRLPADMQQEQETQTETTSAAVVRDGEFGTVASGEFVDIGAGRTIAELSPKAVTTAIRGGSAAVLTEEGTSRVEDAEVVLVDGRPGQIEPSYDPLGYIWTATGDGDILVSGPSGQGLRVAGAWIRSLEKIAVRVSPDGARVAVLVPTDDQNAAVYVAGVLRDNAGAPVGLTELADPQMWVSGEPVDLDWIDSVRFASLSRLGGSSKVTIGGPGRFSTDQGAVAGGVQISSGGSASQLRVLADDGELYVSQGAGWQRSIDEVEVLVKRG